MVFVDPQNLGYKPYWKRWLAGRAINLFLLQVAYSVFNTVNITDEFGYLAAIISFLVFNWITHWVLCNLAGWCKAFKYTDRLELHVRILVFIKKFFYFNPLFLVVG